MQSPTPARSGPIPEKLPPGRSVQTAACVDLLGVQKYLSGLLALGGVIECLSFTPVGVATVAPESHVIRANGDPAGQSRQVPIFAVVAVCRG